MYLDPRSTSVTPLVSRCQLNRSTAMASSAAPDGGVDPPISRQWLRPGSQRWAQPVHRSLSSSAVIRRHPPSKWRHPLNPVRGTQTPRCVMRPTIAETIDRNQEKRRQRREAAGNSSTSPPPIQLQLTNPPRMSFQRHQSTRSSGPNDQRRVQSPPAFHQHFNSVVLSVASVTPLSTATDRPRCNTHPHPNHQLLLTFTYLQRRQPRRTQSTKTQPSITTHSPLVTAGPNQPTIHLTQRNQSNLGIKPSNKESQSQTNVSVIHLYCLFMRETLTDSHTDPHRERHSHTRAISYKIECINRPFKKEPGSISPSH